MLGPLLFLTYEYYFSNSIIIINDYKIFADDLKIYMKIRLSTPFMLALDVSSCQKDINTISSGATSWSLDLNKDKCEVLRIRHSYVPWAGIGTLKCYYLLR